MRRCETAGGGALYTCGSALRPSPDEEYPIHVDPTHAAIPDFHLRRRPSLVLRRLSSSWWCARSSSPVACTPGACARASACQAGQSPRDRHAGCSAAGRQHSRRARSTLTPKPWSAPRRPWSTSIPRGWSPSASSPMHDRRAVWRRAASLPAAHRAQPRLRGHRRPRRPRHHQPPRDRQRPTRSARSSRTGASPTPRSSAAIRTPTWRCCSST